MKHASLFVACAVVALPGMASASFIIAYDDAADATYNSGWGNGSNGGYGFGAWSHSTVGTHAMGNSNANGALGGPGINVGGRAWQAELNPGWSGAVTGRTLGSYSLGDSFEIDVDFGAASAPGQGVAIFGSGDFCQVQAIGTSSGSLLINTNATTIVTSVPYSDGGYRVTFGMVSATALDVTILSFASSVSQTYNVAYAPGSGAQTMTLQTTNPPSGQAIYASRMMITSPVPEPASMIALGIGTLALVRRRSKK